MLFGRTNDAANANDANNINNFIALWPLLTLQNAVLLNMWRKNSNIIRDEVTVPVLAVQKEFYFINQEI